MEQLLKETIISYNNYLGNVEVGCLDIASNLRANHLAKSFNSIIEFSQGMEWLIKASELFNKNGVVTVIETNQINEFLNEINAGLEIQDYVLVADMFEYEIAPFFENCQRVELEEEYEMGS